MIKVAGNQATFGHKGPILIQKNNGSYEKKWANMTLDTLYIFQDEPFTELLTQYSIRGGVQLVKVHESKFEFRMHSEDPHFTINLAALNEDDLEAWLMEIQWRLNSIQKEQSSPPLKKSIRKLRHSFSRSRKLTPPEKQIEMPHLNLTTQQKYLIEKTREWLHESTTNEIGCKQVNMTVFFSEFFKRFSSVNVSAKKLFEDAGLQAQARALVRMLALVCNEKNICNMIEIGGSHHIYGVNETDYNDFSEALIESLEVCLGPDIFTKVMKDAWQNAMQQISQMMLIGATIAHKKITANACVLSKKKWKKSTLSLTLDTLYITKSRGGEVHPLQNILEVEDMDKHGGDIEPVAPCSHGLTITTVKQVIVVCFDSLVQKESWEKEINWRIKAFQRSFNEECDGKCTKDCPNCKNKSNDPSDLLCTLKRSVSDPKCHKLPHIFHKKNSLPEVNTIK